MEELSQYFSSSLVKMYINSSMFPLDIKFQNNSSIFKFSNIDVHPAIGRGDDEYQIYLVSPSTLLHPHLTGLGKDLYFI